MPEINYIEHLLKQQGLTREEARKLQNERNHKFMEESTCKCNLGCRYSAHAYPCECTVRGTYNCKSEEQGRKWTESLKQRGLIDE